MVKSRLHGLNLTWCNLDLTKIIFSPQIGTNIKFLFSEFFKFSNVQSDRLNFTWHLFHLSPLLTENSKYDKLYQNTLETRMHSSRMCTTRSSSCQGGLDLIPLNFPLGCGPGSDPPQFPPWVWAWT